MTNDDFDLMVRESCIAVQAEIFRELLPANWVWGAEMLCDEILKRLKDAE